MRAQAVAHLRTAVVASEYRLYLHSCQTTNPCSFGEAMQCDLFQCDHEPEIPISEDGEIVAWRCKCGERTICVEDLEKFFKGEGEP